MDEGLSAPAVCKGETKSVSTPMQPEKQAQFAEEYPVFDRHKKARSAYRGFPLDIFRTADG